MSQDNGSVSTGGFKKFNDLWYEQLNQLLQELRSALNRPTADEEEEDHRHRQMGELVNKVKSHYVDYYTAKSAAIERDVLRIFVSSWTSSVEKCLQWIGGWRPTTVFHIVYSESSIRFETQLFDIIRGLNFGNLGDLSSFQFSTMSEMQSATVKAENSLTSELSLWQEGASILTETNSGFNVMMSELASILQRADKLRLDTLTNMVELLTSQQAVEFMVAAIELEFGVRGWGKNVDLKRQRA